MLRELTAQVLAAAPAPAPKGAIDNGFFGTLARWAQDFIDVFKAGATQFTGLVTNIIPLLIVLLTAVNALIKLIGPERIDRFGAFCARDGLLFLPLRYLVLPFLAVFFLTNPMAYTMGRFLPESKKPAFYDAAVSFVHPVLGLFPHANPGEYFVYGGIAVGITAQHYQLGDLAVRYFLVGLVVILMRGILTEIITNIMMGRRRSQAADNDSMAVA